MKNTPITENHLFQKAYSKGRGCPGRYAAVYVLRDFANQKFRRADPCHRPLNRLGLTVGKKIGGAVDRVRARRLMREAYRLIEKDGAGGLSLKHGYLVVIAARGRITGAGMRDVKEDLERSFARLGMFEKRSVQDADGGSS